MKKISVYDRFMCISDVIKHEKEQNDILDTMGHDRSFSLISISKTEEERIRSREVIEKALLELQRMRQLKDSEKG